MKAALVAALLCAVLSGCATSTPREKIATGTVRVAFGAPLVLGGASSLVTAGTMAVASQAVPGAPIESAIAPAVGGAVVLTVGAVLLGTGVANLEEGLEPPAPEDREERRRALEKNDRLDTLESTKPTDCQPGWDC